MKHQGTRRQLHRDGQRGLLFLMAAPLLIALVLVVGLGVFWYSYTHSNKDYAQGQRYIVTITPGMTTKDIAELLHAKHLVKTPEAFRLEARVRGLATKLRAGKYEIEGGMSNGEIVEVLSKGQVQLLKFTVPEGFSVEKTARKLEAEGLGSADAFIAAARDYAPYPYMETDNLDVRYKAEGFIYPSTYLFETGATEKDLPSSTYWGSKRRKYSSAIPKFPARTTPTCMRACRPDPLAVPACRPCRRCCTRSGTITCTLWRKRTDITALPIHTISI